MATRATAQGSQFFWCEKSCFLNYSLSVLLTAIDIDFMFCKIKYRDVRHADYSHIKRLILFEKLFAILGIRKASFF